MSCSLCKVLIHDDEKVAEAPCCDQVMHSQCLINLIAHSVGNYHNAICSCSGILYLFENNIFYAGNDNTLTNMEELIKQPAAAAAYKTYRKIIADKTRSFNIFNTKLKETHNVFLDQVGTNIDIIKNVKRELLEGLKQSDEYKNYSSNLRRVTNTANKFKRQFNLNDRDISAITPTGHRWRYRYKPSCLIRRKFNIRI